MPIIKYIEISCDTCMNTFHGYSVAAVKEEARESGWSVNGRVVKCDLCRKAKTPKVTGMEDEG